MSIQELTDAERIVYKQGLLDMRNKIMKTIEEGRDNQFDPLTIVDSLYARLRFDDWLSP